MKYTFQVTLLSMTLLSSACTNNFFDKNPQAIERSIANDIQIPYTVDELFNIKSTSQLESGADFLKTLTLDESLMKFTFVEDPKMPADIAYKIRPEIENQVFTVKIYHSKAARADRDATIELIKTVQSFMREKFYSPYSIFEIYYNGKQKDITSLTVLSKVRAAVFNPPTQYSSEIFVEFYKRQKDQKAEWDNIVAEMQKAERAQSKLIKAQTNERKVVMDALDKVSDDAQFRNLVANNDRKGAAKLIREYLPWELMAPFEKQFWENHLAVMADPVPLHKRVILYRGIDDDLIQVAKTSGKALAKDEAILEKQIFLMSTMLTKNQGTWNRRLRSLTSMNDKFMGEGPGQTTEYSKATRVTNMFTAHSREPKGSPYLSFTPSLDVAKRFGRERITAYFIDPRVAYYNFSSLFASEIEFLLPLTTFPDDLAAVLDKNLHQLPHESYYGTAAIKEPLKQQIIDTLKSKYGAAKATAYYEEITDRTKHYFKSVENGKSGVTKNPKLALDVNIADLYKKLYVANSTAAAKILDTHKDLTCLDLMQAFWK